MYMGWLIDCIDRVGGAGNTKMKGRWEGIGQGGAERI